MKSFIENFGPCGLYAKAHKRHVIEYLKPDIKGWLEYQLKMAAQHSQSPIQLFPGKHL